MQPKIEKVIGWMPLMDIPSTLSAKGQALGGKLTGCYQFALAKDIDEIDDSTVHEKIGYTGKAGDVLGRSGLVRAPKGDHGARHYIDQFNIDREQIMVRYLITADDPALLETYIHEQTEKIASHGFRFAWKEASGGVNGSITYIVSLIQNLEKSAQVTEVVQKARQIGKAKYEEELNYDTI